MNRAASLTRGKRQNTAPVTSLYARLRSGGIPINEKSYREFLQEVKKIINLAKEHKINVRSITGMQNGLGIPSAEKLDKLLPQLRKANKEKT